MIQKNLKQSWNLFSKNRKTIALCLILELVFFALLLTAHVNVFMKASEQMTNINLMLQEATSGTEEDILTQTATLQKNEEFLAEYNQLLKYISLFLFYAFLLWAIIQGMLWVLAHRIVKKKVKLMQYLPKFAGCSIIWFVLFNLVLMISIMALQAAASPVPVVGEGFASVMMFSLMLALGYFASISYSILPEKNAFKKTFSLGIQKAKTIVPAYLLAIAIIFIFGSVSMALFKSNQGVGIAALLIFFLPSLSFGRILIINSTK